MRRLILHLGAITVTSLVIVFWCRSIFESLVLTIALSWMLSGTFGPFHECLHRTAFKSRSLNTVGAWLTGLLFGMAPATYHAFHFEHHRYTQDRDRDPEIMVYPDLFSIWPSDKKSWFKLASGMSLLRLKYLALKLFLKPTPSPDEANTSWIPTGDRRRTVWWQSWVIIGFWVGLVLIAVTVAPAVWWLIGAGVGAHVWQNLWISCEHTGLPLEGTILERTRSVRTNRFVRWWNWNMNYHAEHHAWPGIPWHQLPDAHAQVEDDLDHWVSGYAAVHSNVYYQRNMPSADT